MSRRSSRQRKAKRLAAEYRRSTLGDTEFRNYVKDVERPPMQTGQLYHLSTASWTLRLGSEESAEFLALHRPKV